MIYLIFLISIFIHELSHIIVGYCFGYKLKKIRMLPLGFYIEFEKNEKIIFIKKIIILLSGPISNFFISLFFYEFNTEFSEKICLINIFLGIFNLFPIYPLDGENILSQSLKIIYGYKKGNNKAFIVSKISLCCITFLYSLIIIKIKNLSILLVIIFLWYKNFEKENKIKIEQSAYRVIEKSHFLY